MRRRAWARLAALVAGGVMMGVAAPARAQSAFTAMLLVQPYPSPFVADWQRNPQMAVLTLLYTGTGPTDFRVQSTVTSATKGELARVISPPLNYGTGPVTQVITSADVLDWNTVSRNQTVTDAVLRTGVLPEGAYQICATVQTLQGASLAQACSDFSIALPDPPQLIFPINGGSTVGAQPVFQWTPVMVPPELGVTYRVRIVELLSGQNPATAMAANPTWFETDVTGPSMLVYPLDGLPLDPAKQYVWEVLALDGNGQPLTKGGRSSELWTFSVGTGGGAVAGLPDAIDLIPGVARLTGLSSATIQSSATDYTVTGTLTLEMMAPFTGSIQVDAQDLDLDRTALGSGTALVRSGTLRGTLAAADVPIAMGGPGLQYNEIDYAAGTGLTMKGRLTMGGLNVGSTAELAGQVQVTAAGVYGTLSADAGTGPPIAILGADPVRLLVKQARITVPGGAITLSGGLELFDADEGCGGVSGTVSPDGSFTANISCMPTTPVPLGQGPVGSVARAQILLHSVTGTFHAPPTVLGGVTVQGNQASVAGPDYDLKASAELKLDASTSSSLGTQTGGANCGASLNLAVATGAVTVSDFTPRCDAGEGDADLGWMHARLSSLALQKFSYAAGKGFDYALTVDLAPWVPAMTGLELPSVSAVTITPAGLGVPALDVTMTRPLFDLGGFGVRLTHVRLPAFTLSWSDWSARSATGFAWSVDAELSFTGLPGGGPSCLAGQPITISNATIAKGRFTAHLDSHAFTPPCALTLNAAFTSGAGAAGAAGTGAAGATGAAATGAASGATTGTAAGGGSATDTGADPYQAIQEPPVSDPPLPDPSKAWPTDPAAAAALKQKELSQIESAEAAYLAGLNDPKCDVDCQRKLKAAYDSTQSAIWTTWSDRSFGAQSAKISTCLATERQKALMSIESDETCGVYPLQISTLKEYMQKLKPPTPPATMDCQNDAAYDVTVALGSARQLELEGLDDSIVGLDQSLSAMRTYCNTQAVNQFIATCKAGQTVAMAAHNYAILLGSARQDALLGASTMPDVRIPTGPTDCDILGPAPAAPATGSTAPPPTSGGAPQGLGAWGTSGLFFGPSSGGGASGDPRVAQGTAGPRPARDPVTDSTTWATSLTLSIDSIGGDIDVVFSPYLLIAKVPAVTGSVKLPPIFSCPDSSKSQMPLGARIRFGPHGELDGTILGFLPSCPINLAAVQVTATSASLTFSTAGGSQAIVLAATATASFTLASTPVSGQGSIAIDLLHGRLIAGRLSFPGPVAFALPHDSPVLAFTLPSVTLDMTGVHIDGRAQLGLTSGVGASTGGAPGAGGTATTTPGSTAGTSGGQAAGGPAVGATFDQVTINPQTFRLTSGKVTFDAPFALEVGVAADGSLGWHAVAAGAPLDVQTGLRVDLPAAIVLDPSGFGISGSALAHLVFGGRDIDSLVAGFTSDFALGFTPPGVTRGTVDLQHDGVSLAYIDNTGLHANLAYFADAALPARLPLPTSAIAYLQLRDASGTLLVSTQNTGNGIRIFTPPGKTVSLVIPALQLGRATAPQVDVTFDLTLDPLGQNVAAGSLSATVPSGSADAFDLSAVGLPVALETIAYDRITGGGYQWTFAAALRLFGQRQEPAAGDQVRLTLDGTGRLAGSVSLTTTQTIPLVPGSQNATLSLQKVQGAFNASLPAHDLRFDLTATGGIDLALAAGQTYHAGATIDASDQGVAVTNLTYEQDDAPRWLDLSVFKLGVQRLRIPTLAYTPQSGFTFEILFDALLQFPTLGNVTLPPLQDVSLSNAGFRIPAYEVPDLNADIAPVSGFTAKLLAFRMNAISYNWFTGQAPADWGFGFDLQLGFGDLMAGLPPSLQGATVRLLNAGLRNGKLYGTLERATFATPIDIGIGKLTALSGDIPATGSGFSLTADVDLDLSAIFPVCSGASLKKPGNTLSIAGNGWVTGTISGVLPSCATNLGPFAVAFGQSDVTFTTTGSGATQARSIQVAAAATIKFPGATPGDTVSATGTIGFDALQGKWLSGSIALDKPFRFNPVDKNPYLAFTVQHASLDNGGLHFTGQGDLNTGDGAQVTVQFNNFTFGLPDLKVQSGSVTFLSQFALGVGITNGTLTWGAMSPTAPRPSGPSFRAIVPDTVTIDAQGLYLGGSASAELAYGDTVFGSASVQFTQGFRVGFAPLAVTAGRAAFVVGTDEVAHVDPTGFWPGNVFGVLPIPAKLGLPSEDVAYLELRDAQNNLLIETQTSANGIELRTKSGQTVRLVVPSLAGGGQAPAANVAFDVVVNQSNMQFISGSVRAQADPSGTGLFSLASLGVPLAIRSLVWDKVPGGQTYALTLAGRVTLPASLNGLDIDVPNLTLSAAGLSGEVRLGSEIQGAGASTSPIVAQSFLGDTLQLAVTGADLKFGNAGNAFTLDGTVSSALFAPSGQAAAQLAWKGTVTPSDFTLELDPGNATTIPIAVAQFTPTAVGSEPALRITANAQEFALRMSGVLTVPTISPSFAVTIAGFQVGTKGVVFPTVSLQGIDQQQFDLFGATFRLQDSTAAGTMVYPAIAVGVQQGAVALTLSGAVDFLGNTSRFYGFTVTTKGQMSIAGASLLSKPLVLVQNVLSVDALTLQNNALRTDLSVTLPEPLNASGAQKVNFTIDASGNITGGADLAVINEAPSLTGNASTHFTLGDVATVHLRYLGLTLDFANLRQNSAVTVVSDVYLENAETNLIKLGDVVGGTVQPGIRVGFDGTVTWGNIALARQFDFDFEAVKLTISQVSFPAQQTGFAIDLSGTLGLDLNSVTGGIGFKDLIFTSQGQLQFSPNGITGGEFAIAGVVTLQVANFGYSSTPTTIQIQSGSMPTGGTGGQAGAAAATATQTVAVDSYITFGGTISIEDSFSGGVQKFLLYRATDQTSHLLIQHASLKIEDIVDFWADFRYDQTAGGFEMLLGGQGTLWSQYQIAVVGAVEADAGKTRLGIFLAANGLGINITPYLRLDGVGGGFFLNPKAEYLDMVRVAAGVSQTAGRVIAPPPEAQFAVMFYGNVAFLQGVISGRSLLTVTDQMLLMDGTVTILGQTGRLTGDHHLAIGLKQAYAEGNMSFKVDYGTVISGTGTLDFYVYDDKNWGVLGTTQMTIIDFLKGTSDLFVGPPGFYVKSHIGASYNVAILTITGSIDCTVWYMGATNEWGGYTAIGVDASVLGGLASASGTLEGALIIQQQPELVAAAVLKASVVGQSWEGWAWVKFQNQQVSGGLGADPAVVAAINEAKNVADEMTNAKNNAVAAIDQAKATTPPAVTLTSAELSAAYRNQLHWSPDGFKLASTVLLINEYSPVYADPQTIGDYLNWYVGVLHQSGAPGDSTPIIAGLTTISNQFAGAETDRPQVQSRIAALGMSIQTLAAGATNPPLPGGSPVQSASVAPPVTQDVTGADGLMHRQVVSGPGFAVDAAAASAQRTAMTQASQLADANDLAVRQQIAALEAGLATVRAATTSSDAGALPHYAANYAAIASGAEQEFAAQADYLLQRQDWMQARLSDLAQKQSAILGTTGWVHTKTAAFQSANKIDELKALVRGRLGMLGVFLGADSALTRFDGVYNGLTSSATRWDYLTKNADSSGVQLWYQLGAVGMTDAILQTNADFGALRTSADQRLTTIRAAHGALSQALTGLYQVQADATGALYDLYDRYLASGGPHVPPTTGGGLAGSGVIAPAGTKAAAIAAASATPTAADLLDPSLLTSRRTQLAQDLTVPRINSVSVTTTSATRYAAQLQVTWSAWHPTGTYEFEFNDADAAATGLTSLYSNGSTGALSTSRFTPDRTVATTLNRSVTVGARGGAGYLATGRTNYTLTFQPGSSAPAGLTGGTGLTSDNTPPSTPVVSFPDLSYRDDATGVSTAWTNDPTRVTAQWSADDPESGVGLYEYALWSTSTGTSSVKGGPALTSIGARPPVLRDFTGAGGRTDVTINQLGLTAGQPLYVSVRATNGQGGVSASGVSIPLRYDPTPPAFPAGAALTPVPTVVPAPPVSAVATYAACPVTPAALPGMFAIVSVLSPAPTLAWSGTLGAAVPAGATPSATFTRPDAADGESGVAAYYYRVSAQANDTIWNASWTQTSARSPNVVASGAPLDYQNPFWIAVVARNTAGSVSGALTYGPFRVTDPTPPNPPVICAGMGTATGQIGVQLMTPAIDNETAVTGYQYRISSGKVVVRQWSEGVTPDWPAAGGTTRTAGAKLSDGTSYVVDVRALNQQGAISGFVSSGPLLYDLSPPPAPTASVSATAGIPLIVVSAPTDPHSGLTMVQWAVGTTQTGADVQPWAASAVAPAGGTITLPFAAAIPTGQTLWLQVRSVNGTGLTSTIFSTSFSLPAPPKLQAPALPVRLP